MTYDKYAACTCIRIGYTTTTTMHVEYMAFVEHDGTWMMSKRDYNRTNNWREVNGICEEAEPVFFAALPKAQALAILKG
jgi:hypothetical protein